MVTIVEVSGILYRVVMGQIAQIGHTFGQKAVQDEGLGECGRVGVGVGVGAWKWGVWSGVLRGVSGGFLGQLSYAIAFWWEAEFLGTGGGIFGD
jgi:hypothetical protein